MSSDFLKGALDVLIEFLEILTKLIDTIGVIPTLAGGFAIFKTLKTAVGLGGISELADILPVLSEAFPRTAKGASNFTAALKGTSGAAKGAGGALGSMFSLLKNPYIAAAAIAITAVTAAIMYQKKKAEELSEEVDELTSKYQEQHSTLMQNKGDFDTSNASSLASRYKELSKGVDGLGRNISLTADEYAEYQSVCNSIAEQVPSLVSGYDEQGNAILNCKGNVEELTEAYHKLIHAQNQDVLTNAGDIEKDFKNELKKQSGEHWYSNGHGFWQPLLGSFGDYELKNDTVKNLEDWLNATSRGEKNQAISKLKADPYSAEELRDALTSAGIEVGVFDNVWKELEKAYEKDPQKIKGIIDNYSAQFDELVNQQKTIAEAKLSEAFDVDSAISGMDYSGISENLQAVAHGVINSFDYDFLTQLSEQGKSVESWVTDMLDQLNAISDADSAEIDAAFNLQTKFNDNQISYGGYIDQIRDISDTIDSLNVSDEVKSQIKLALNTEEVVEQYDALSKKLTSEKYDIQLDTKEAEAFLNSLTSEELSVLTQIIPELSKNGVNETVDDLRAEIEKAMAMNPPTIDIAVETERLETLTSAITESLSGVGLSGEATTAIESMFSNLGSYDASKLFERTANGIRLNSDELRRLNNEYADTNMSALNNKMSDLGDLYAETQIELSQLTYGTEEYNDKVGELSAIEAQINSVETLATQYEGLTSAYNQWQQAEAAGQQRDMYENVIKGLENIDDEISRGWVDDATIEFLELLSGQDLSTAGIEKIKKAYDGLDKTIKDTSYSVRDFFTVDDEGNSTNAGVYNFLDAVGQLEEEKFGGKDIIQRDKKGNIIGFDFQIAGGDEVIAEALGVSEELVQIMVRAADDAGFVVSMDGTYQQLDILKEKAQKAAESLKRIMGKDGVDFNFNASTIEEITPQLKEAEKILDSFRNKDGSINLEMEGAEEAFTVASTLQSMLDKLTRPAYMDIQTSQVDKELQKPLENLQEYRRLVETEHQLKLSGADTSELEKSKSEILDYFEDIQANNPELAVELGIDGDSRKELEKKISEGEFEIPATVDIQMEMDDKLGILVDKALLEAGIIDKKEFKKRVDIYLDADVDNKDAKDKTNKAVKEVADNKGGKSSGRDGKSSGKKVKKNVDVEVKADKVDTSDVKKKADDAVKKSNKGEKKKTQKKTDVEVKADKIDTSDIEKETDKAIGKNGKSKRIRQNIDIETKTDDVDTSETEKKVKGAIHEANKTEKKIDVKLSPDPSGLLDYTPEEMEVITRFKADYSEVENYTPEEKQAIAKYLADTEQVESYTPAEKEAIAKFKKNSAEVDDYKPADKEAIAKYLKNSAEVDNYKVEPKFGVATYNKDVSDITNWTPPKKEGKVWYKIQGVIGSIKDKIAGLFGVNGTANVDGTAYINGTIAKSGRAFKQGNWRTKESVTALTGELGQELVVPPNGNRWYTVGDNGAEFANIPKGSIVFNHKQTEELFKNGKVTSGGGRGRALANGTAFVEGTAFVVGSNGSGGIGKVGGKSVTVKADTVKVESKSTTTKDKSNKSTTKNKTTKSKDTKKKSKDTKDKFQETFDWIEIKISRIERAIDRLDQKASRTWKSWSYRNTNLTDEISKIDSEITNLDKAADKYLAAANAVKYKKNGKYVKLDEKWKKKVRNGTIDFSTITNESLAEAIKEYQDYYEKYLEMNDKILDAQDLMMEKYREQFDNVLSEYDGFLSQIEHRMSMLDEFIAQQEASGHIVSKIYYQELIDQENQNISKLKAERDELIKARAAWVAAGGSTDSEDWYNMTQEINATTLSIEEGKTALIEYANAIRDIEWEVFDLIQERIQLINDEADFFIDIMSHYDLYDDKGQLTDEGMATMGLYAQQYSTHMEKAANAWAEVEKLNGQIAKAEGAGDYDQDLIDRRNEKLQEYWDEYTAGYDKAEDIRSMVEEGIELELDALQEKIDMHNEELDSMKSIYDYQKKVSEQTKNIASLRKQLSAYEGDDSEEAQAKIQELRVSLKEAETELEETEFDKYIESQEELLDSLYDQYSEILNTRLDDIDALLADMISEVNSDANKIAETIEAVAEKAGYDISNEMDTIWNNKDEDKDVVSTYAEGKPVEDSTTNDAVEGVEKAIKDAVNASNKEAITNIKEESKTNKENTTYTKPKSSNANKSNTNKNNNTNKTNTNKNTSKTIKKGGKIKATGAKIYDYKGDKSGETQYYKKDPIYKVLKIDGSWIQARYHKLKSGVSGWFKKGDVKAYATGKKNFLSDEIAWTQEAGREFIIRPSDGAILTPLAKGDSVLNANASSNIWDMANNPTEFIKNNLDLGVGSVPNNINVQSNYTQTIENVNFDFKNVKNYDEILAQMQKDKNFEKLVLAMSVDRIAGKSSLAKGKAIR